MSKKKKKKRKKERKKGLLFFKKKKLNFSVYLFISGYAEWHAGSQFPDQGSNL